VIHPLERSPGDVLHKKGFLKRGKRGKREGDASEGSELGTCAKLIITKINSLKGVGGKEKRKAKS